MARIPLGALTTLNLATHLDPQFVDLYNLRELINSPGYAAATPRLTIDAAGNVGVGTSTPNKFPIQQVVTINAPFVGNYAGLELATEDAINGSLVAATHETRLTAHGAAFIAAYTGNVERLRIGSSGHITPGADNTQNIGSGALRMGTIFAGTGTINTSDAREKAAVAPMTENEINAAKALAAEIGTFQFQAAIAEKGEAAARHHVGMTVQRVIDVMQSHGLDPMRYGFICHDTWPARIEPAQFQEKREETGLVDSNNEPIYNITQVEIQPERVIPAGDRFAFRPDELLLFIARGFEARLSALEAAAAA